MIVKATDNTLRTAVIRHHDGSYQSVLRIDGNDEYLTTMRDLSTGPKERAPYAGNGAADGFARKWMMRKARKAVGLPATTTTAVLANMVKKLHTIAETLVDQKLAGCVITSSDHIRFHYDELNDILDYLRLRNPMESDQYPNTLGATSAAYTGLGEGICPDYLDAQKCEWFEDDLPSRRVLHLDLSSVSLIGTIDLLHNPYGPFPDHSFISSDLGLESTGGDVYWPAVEHRIRELIKELTDGQHITYLILTGTAASNGRFKSVVKDALHDVVKDNSQASRLLEQDLQAEEELDLVFLTARGAAEVAKRRQTGPWKCRDTPKGAQRRRDQRPKPEEVTPVLLEQDL